MVADERLDLLVWERVHYQEASLSPAAEDEASRWCELYSACGLGFFFLNAFFLLAIKVGGIHRLWKALVGAFTTSKPTSGLTTASQVLFSLQVRLASQVLFSLQVRLSITCSSLKPFAHVRRTFLGYRSRQQPFRQCDHHAL